MLQFSRPQNKRICCLKYWVIHPTVNSLTVLILLLFFFQMQFLNELLSNCANQESHFRQELYTLHTLSWLLISWPGGTGYCFVFPTFPWCLFISLSATCWWKHTHCNWWSCASSLGIPLLDMQDFSSARLEESVSQQITVFFLRQVFRPREPYQIVNEWEQGCLNSVKFLLIVWMAVCIFEQDED